MVTNVYLSLFMSYKHFIIAKVYVLPYPFQWLLKYLLYFRSNILDQLYAYMPASFDYLILSPAIDNADHVLFFPILSLFG